jgi:hypothetical protein
LAGFACLMAAPSCLQSASEGMIKETIRLFIVTSRQIGSGISVFEPGNRHDESTIMSTKTVIMPIERVMIDVERVIMPNSLFYHGC